MGDPRPLRALYAGAVAVPGWRGGEPVFADLLLRGLAALGVEVASEGSRRTFWELAALATTPYDAELSRVVRYRRALRRRRPDVVLVGFDFDSSWVVAARKERIPVIACIQIYWPTCPVGTRYIDGQGVCDAAGLVKCLRHIPQAEVSPNFELPIGGFSPPLALVLYGKYRLRRAALSQADVLVANSAFEGQVLAKAGYENVRVIPNGVDLSTFTARRWDEPTKTVLFPVARSRQERKGFDHFVRMARAVHASFPEVKYRALNDPGDGLIEGSSYLTRPELVEQFRTSYLAVVPGLWDEPFGFVAAEAMACGRPVVMYDGGGSEELIEDGVSGVLVPRGDLDGLVRAVSRLLCDEAAARRMGAAARTRVEGRFGHLRMAERYLELIREIVPRPESERRVSAERVASGS